MARCVPAFGLALWVSCCQRSRRSLVQISTQTLTNLIGSFTSIATRVAGGLTDTEAQLFPPRRGLRGRDESPWIASLGGIRQGMEMDASEGCRSRNVVQPRLPRVQRMAKMDREREVLQTHRVRPMGAD